MKICNPHALHRALALLLAFVLCFGLASTAFAAQEDSYHDPAEYWLSASNRTNELDANAIVTSETFYCAECNAYRAFTVWRTPEYTRDGATALSRNVMYSDGTTVDGENTGSILDGVPGVNAWYTGYHWTKASCQTCGTINGNMGVNDYGHGKNVYWLYDCAAEFMVELEETVAYEYVSDLYHEVTVTGGSYCGFCYGTYHTEETELEHHDMEYTVTAEPGNLRFVRTGTCADCGYATTEYVTAKAVIQSYLGTVDGDAHTIVVSDLSDSGVSVSIRYGLTADSCTMTAAPTYDEAGTNYIYYAITYTYKGESMTENGVTYVTLVEAAAAGSNSTCACGCGDTDCGCKETSCSGNCCGTCSNCDHSNSYSYTIDATCTALGYTKYICLDCGTEWNSDYISATGHLYQYFTTNEATCETAGKTIGICVHCGFVTTETTEKADHQYSTYTVSATCTSPGYTVHECSVCGDRYISDITAILSHSYTAVMTAATCTTAGKTVYFCTDCSNSYAGSYIAAYGHDYVATEITAASCNGAGVTQYKCAICGDTYLVAQDATGHTPGEAATCTEGQYCLDCGAIIALPTGHDYTMYVTAATCADGGYTTHICANCGDSYVDGYTDAHGHDYVATEITAASCNGAGVTQYKCADCGDTYLVAQDATGHTPGDAATCTTPQLCIECGAVIENALGHDYVAEIVDATCTTMGYTVYACSRCGESHKSDYTEAIGHSYGADVIEPTCTEGGYTTYTCANCGDSYVTDYTDVHGHTFVAESITLPTCNGAGVTQYTCVDCGEHYLEAESATGHTPGEAATCTSPQLCIECGAVIENALGHDYVAEIVDATCTTMGYTVYTCSRCGESHKSDYTEATGHSYEAVVTEPTCLEDGYTTCTCANCRDSYVADYTDAHGHTFVAESITLPTCNGAGVTQYTCADCGEHYLEAESATGHNINGVATCTEASCCLDCGAILALPTGHSYEAVVTDPTCTEGGYTTYTCANCGDSYVADHTDAHGHTFVAESITLPTCNGAGVTQYTCVDCGEHYLEAESATGHNINGAATCTEASYCLDCGAILALPTGHNYEAVVTEPTCLEGGYTTCTCANCGDSYVTDYTDALGHAWDEGRIVTDSMCGSEGVIEYRCERCGYHRLEAVSIKGHTPGDEATCTTAQLCTVCGAILAEPIGHSYEAAVTGPTCTELGYTTYTCTSCGDSYDTDYVNAVGHTAGGWIVDVEPTTSSEGSRHRECVDCGEVLETERIDRIYLFGYTDVYGETVIGDYLVTVTDTSSANPVPNAAVTLGADGTLCVVLPDGRLIDYAAQTTVTVQMLADGTPVPNVGIVVTDEKDNYSSGETDEAGKLTVPFTSGVTNADGRVTAGGTDANGNLITLTVKVEDFESARPIEGALVTVTNGVLDILLPDGTDMDEGNRILVTVLDNAQAPVRALDVAVRNDLGRQEQGQTNRDGKLIVPALSSAYTDENGTVILGKYTVIVTDSVDKPVSGALVTLIESGDGDSFTVLLPSGRLLDANDQTTVTVLLPSADPAVGLSVTVSDGNGNHAAKVTNSAGQVVVPNKTASGGETVGKTDSTYNVEVTDSSGDPIDGADTSIGEDGTVTVVLPDDVTLDEEDPVTVTVTDNDGNPVEDVPVTVTDSEGSTARGETDATGSVTVPSAAHAAYIYGYADGTVRPNAGMTRAEAAAVFARILAEACGDVPGGYSTTSYDDVSTDSWYYEYVAYLDTLGIVVGYGDGSFGPDDTITRYEFVTICVRLSSLMAMQDGSDTVSNFSDVSGGHWAYSYVKTAAVHGWIIGYTDSLFRGDNDISRAEVVTIVNRFLGRSVDEDYVDANLDKLNTFTDLWNPHVWYYYDMMEAANSHSIVTGASAETWCD